MSDAERAGTPISRLFEPRVAAPILVAAGLAILAGAFAFQYLGGVQPCVLCLYQRYAHGAAIAVGVIALVLFWSGRTRALAWLVGACGLVFLAGGGIAVFHVGVEQHWWEGTASCGGIANTARTLEELRAQIMAAPVVRCDEVSWSLFGISLAGYNVLMSAALGAYALVAAARGVATGARR